jgi:hypothetical protein
MRKKKGEINPNLAYDNRVEKVYKELKEQLEGFDVTFDPFNKDFNTKITKIRSNFKVK